MQEPNIKNVQELLRQNRGVKNLSAQAGTLQALQKVLGSVLPSVLTDYCRVKRFDGRTLYLEASTGTVATQLRFIQAQLVPKLRQFALLASLETINIRVGNSPDQTTRQPKTRKTPPVSAANRQLLEDTADGISDAELAASLRALASTLKGL